MLYDKYSAIPYFEFLKGVCEMTRCKKCTCQCAGTVFSGAYAYGVSRRVIGRIPVLDGLPVEERKLYWNYCREGAVIEEITSDFFKIDLLKSMAENINAPFDDKCDVRMVARVEKFLSDIRKIDLTEKKLSKLLIKGEVMPEKRHVNVDIVNTTQKKTLLSTTIPLVENPRENRFSINFYDFLKVAERMESPLLCFYHCSNFFRISKQGDEKGKTVFAIKNYGVYK